MRIYCEKVGGMQASKTFLSYQIYRQSDLLAGRGGAVEEVEEEEGGG